ncbi:denn domain-containing protein [Novymonas esmeraldas]|uniref:Denn domain-containing protein n=1 Tax=Novymonas esmeraldas TaxID=1808958 RepID=A0AAW0F5J9_9TRYP
MDGELVDLSAQFQGSRSSFADYHKKETAFTSKSQVFYNKGNEHSCINCFLVMRLERHSSGEEVVKISWSYPYTPTAVLLRYPNLGKFAMANAGTSYTVDQLSYTFVLTDSKGVREYGHTTAFVNGEAVVTISPYPWCNFFYRLGYLFVTNGTEGGQKLVKALCKCPTPPSGGMFNTPLDLGLTFNRPYDRLCSFIDTAPLDMLVIFPNIDDLFSVLADLMLEKHVIIVGPNFSIVSNVVMSLQALVAPFDWMHILIPILPTSLLDVLAAPPPYLVGILTSQLPHVARVPLDAVVAVHLGPDGVCERVDYQNETRDRLPHSSIFSALRTGLSILRMRHPKDQTVRDLCSLFLTYYASLFGEIVLKGAHGYVRNERLSEKTHSFFEKLLCTQSFTILSEEVKKALDSANSNDWMDNEFIVAAVRGQSDVFPAHYEALVEEEKNGGGFIEKYEDCFGSKESFNGFTAAVHGFGGHQLGVGRLLMRCLCSHWCGPDLAEESDDNYYPGRRMGQAILQQQRYRAASSSAEAPVITSETMPMEMPSMHADPHNGAREFEVSISATTPSAL